MKTIKTILATVLVLACMNEANAQLSPYKFNQLFDQAFQNVLVGNYAEAIPVLTTLNKSDAEHAQVQFLLAMCSIKEGKVSERELQLLQSAVKRYDFYHQSGNAESRTAPAKAWFFLAEVCAELKHHEKAVSAYRNYMSCIPLATIEHKKMIVDRIAECKSASNGLTTQGSSFLLANGKP